MTTSATAADSTSIVAVLASRGPQPCPRRSGTTIWQRLAPGAPGPASSVKPFNQDIAVVSAQHTHTPDRRW